MFAIERGNLLVNLADGWLVPGAVKFVLSIRGVADNGFSREWHRHGKSVAITSSAAAAVIRARTRLAVSGASPIPFSLRACAAGRQPRMRGTSCLS